MVTLTRIDLTSAIKIGALLSAALYTLASLLGLGLQSVFFSLFDALNVVTVIGPGGTVSTLPTSSALAGLGLAAGCFLYFIGLFFVLIGGALGGLATAFCYNLIASWFGGLRIVIDPPPSADKSKRSMSIIPDVESSP